MALTPKQLDEHRHAVRGFLQKAAALTAEQWLTARAEGKWNPAEEATHLVLTYRAYTTELQRGPDVTPESFPPRLLEFRETMLPRILAGGWFPSGGASPGVAVPSDASGKQEDTIAELESSAREFESALVSADEANSNRFARHPYFGALSLPELLKVLTEHTRHHASFLPT